LLVGVLLVGALLVGVLLVGALLVGVLLVGVLLVGVLLVGVLLLPLPKSGKGIGLPKLSLITIPPAVVKINLSTPLITTFTQRPVD